jgi:hypothetical protein
MLRFVCGKKEFGHNWGSEHDPLKPECTPTASGGGNFIMYAYSNQGHERNNYVCNVNVTHTHILIAQASALSPIFFVVAHF